LIAELKTFLLKRADLDPEAIEEAKYIDPTFTPDEIKEGMNEHDAVMIKFSKAQDAALAKRKANR
jgi:hypothetical protein